MRYKAKHTILVKIFAEKYTSQVTYTIVDPYRNLRTSRTPKSKLIPFIYTQTFVSLTPDQCSKSSVQLSLKINCRQRLESKQFQKLLSAIMVPITLVWTVRLQIADLYVKVWYVMFQKLAVNILLEINKPIHSLSLPVETQVVPWLSELVPIVLR